jgi:alpha-tubulin suppressor-like RCC1 family protein
VQVFELTNITAIAAGGAHSLALRSDGTIWAWGENSRGQLGDGATTNRPIPTQVSGLTNITAIAAGGAHSLAVHSDGTVWAWGFNNHGQLGEGSRTNRLAPVQVAGLTNITTVAASSSLFSPAGSDHSLALSSDGTVWAWGFNTAGQLGNGTTTDRHSPVPLSELSPFIAIAAGPFRSLALSSNGTVWAWGSMATPPNDDTGTLIGSLTPVQVPGFD